jgi:hypothetical protein
VAVAVEPDGVGVTADPNAVPDEHPEALVSGPHSKKVTDPVGAPAIELPVMVTLSVSVVPRVGLVVLGVLFVTVLAWVTLKHSRLLPSDDVR